MTNNFLQVFEELNKLYESKEDQERFLNWAGKDLANKFYKIKDRLSGQEKDIYYWMKKSPEELEDKINQLLKVKTRSQQNKNAKDGADLIYSDDTWNVYHIKTFEASKKYGANTKWCITGKESGWIKDENENIHWKNYKEQGIEFYFYINKEENKKYALALYPDKKTYELFNEKDTSIEGIINAPKVTGLPDITLVEFEIENGTLIRYNGNSDKITIPNTVKIIGYLAFNYCKSLTSVVIPNSVTTIGKFAFNSCESLTNVVIPNSVTEIDERAFNGCASLTNINIPNSVTTIGESAFDGCISLTSITIPNSVTTIGGYAFYKCESLTNVVIPNSVTEIDERAFDGCISLTSITIPSSVTAIRYSAFANCTSLTSITIPNSVTTIGGYAFYKCKSLTDIKIPNSVTTIENFAFSECRSLRSIIIPNSVKVLESSIFEKCKLLTIYCEAPSKPSNWYTSWNFEERPVVWGYKNKN